MTKTEINQIEKRAMGYIEDVLSGKILACRFVKLACKRHLKDLKHGKKRGLYFDKAKAARTVKFFSFLKLWKGSRYKGKEFVLAPHYTFITWSLMGWYRLDGTRRFREAYIEMGRKGAKSTYAGGLAAFFFIADGEQGAEVYTAATKEKQAMIVWENIANLTRKTGFAKRIEYQKKNLNIKETWSKCEPLSKDYVSKPSSDGLDTFCGVFDELHAHPDRIIYDLVKDSKGARLQPMILSITTAGFNQTGICYDTREYVTQILKGTRTNDSFFGIIYTLDMKKDWPDLRQPRSSTKKRTAKHEDDWTDEDVWVKAVPGLLGITKSGKRFGLDRRGKPIPGYMTLLEDMRDECEKAKAMPAAQNNFKTKRLSIWTQQEERWIDLTLWDQNNIRPINEAKLLGRPCVGGIDLASVSDLLPWVMLFPDEKDKKLIDILVRVWCPEARLFDTKNKYQDDYKAWAEQGYLMTTPGDAIDYDFVRGEIAGVTKSDGTYIPGDADKFNIQSISVDRLFQGYEFSQKLNDELGGTEKQPAVIACGMGFLSMAGPCKEFENRLLQRKLNHGGNPLLRWCADNVSVSTDPAGNKKPNKATSQGKIDPIVAILLGLDRLLRTAETTSVYEGRGVLAV